MKKAYIPRMGVPQKVAQTQKAVAIKEAALRKIMIETGGMERINAMNCFLPVIFFNPSQQHSLKKRTAFLKNTV